MDSYNNFLKRPTEGQIINISKNILINRGLNTLRPKRINLEKATVTATRQAVNRGISEIPTALIVEPESDLGQVHKLLNEFDNLTMSSHSISSLLNQIQNNESQCVWSVCGKALHYSAHAHDGFSQSLVNYQPEYQQQFLKELSERQLEKFKEFNQSIPKRANQICVEIKPGKISLLDLMEPTVNYTQKSWETVIQGSKKDQKPQIAPVELGFGIASCLIGREQTTKESRYLKYTFAQLDLQQDAFDLSTSKKIYDLASKWVQDCGLGSIGDLKNIYVSIPSKIISSQFRSQWKSSSNFKLKDDIFEFEDLIWGWHPVLTLMTFFANASLPALFVHTGDFPEVNLVLIEGANA